MVSVIEQEETIVPAAISCLTGREADSQIADIDFCRAVLQNAQDFTKNPDYLTGAASNLLKGVVGIEVKLPKIPEESLAALDLLRKQRVKAALFYLPELDLSDPGLLKDLPEGYIIPCAFVYEAVKAGRMEPDVLKVKAGWRVAETIAATNLYGENCKGDLYYPRDWFVGKIVANLRRRGQLTREKMFFARLPFLSEHIPVESRFDLLRNEIVRNLCPEISNLLGLPEGSVRLPSVVERNLLVNLVAPDIARQPVWEWTRNSYQEPGKPAALPVFAGHAFYGGASSVGWETAGLEHQIGFKLVIGVNQQEENQDNRLENLSQR